MHILIIAIGSAGDVHPFLGLGRTFARQGHRVSFCTSPAFAPIVERSGLRLLPLGTAEEYQAAMNDPALWNPKTSFKVLWKIMAGFIRPLFDILETEVDNETIMVGSLWAFGARLMQEKYGVPYVSVQVSPSTFISARLPPVHKRFSVPASWPYSVRAALFWAIERGILDRVCGPDLNRERATLGLPPVKHILGQWLHSPQGVLGLFPRWFAPPQIDWPRQVSLTGFPLFDESEFHEMDAELEDFLAGGPAPVVFTPGSTMVDSMTFFKTAADTLNGLGKRGIFLAKQGEPMPPLPSSIVVRSYVPLSKLLPRAKILVHHGGIGTVSQAFAAGIPQLAVPFAHDQFDNAARMERLGCGLRLDAPISGPSLRTALLRLLEEESFQKNSTATRLRVDSGEVSCLKALSVIEAVGVSHLHVAGPSSGPQLVHAG
ncbi:glycosyltransferase [Granulicella arctica]|uniref:Rhamnosyltransferase subunit B n=1 Tax=Granulicella arctica TaxID=940613 RepID=A0A7Y9PDR0_9BACT|nr:nucleotide disphospho-sugar-binding domain-containing protein [Granulicella arctica]NYF78052.1 rhamnosyltransferase subunit B [Granulicella arctica]